MVKFGARPVLTRSSRELALASRRLTAWKFRWRRQRKSNIGPSRARACVNLARKGAKEIAMATGVGVIVFIGAIFILSGLKVLNEYESAGVFRLVRLTPYRGPGVDFVIPVLLCMTPIALGSVTLRIPP